MPLHADFHAFLGGLPNGAALQTAHHAYKTAENMGAYTANGYLKGSMPMPDDLAVACNNLRQCIRGRNTEVMTLWRMTSDREFTGTILSREINEPFTYHAFMSTSGRPGDVHSFVPEAGHRPLLLEIRCPVNTTMAPMEAGDDQGLENEFLLGSGTKFNILETGQLTDEDLRVSVGIHDPAQIAFRMVIEVAQNPTYANGFNEFFDFAPPPPPEVDVLEL
jgi:hypothetical protein